MKDEIIKLQPGESVLVIAKDGEVIHASGNMALTHVEFVKRAVGTLPDRAWVGTISKDKEGIVVISSKTFYGFQLPAPDWVTKAVEKKFK